MVQMDGRWMVQMDGRWIPIPDVSMGLKGGTEPDVCDKGGTEADLCDKGGREPDVCDKGGTKADVCDKGGREADVCDKCLSPGHADAFLVSAGSGVITLGLPDSPGVPKGAAAGTLTAAYNDLDSVKALLEANKEEGVSAHMSLCVFFCFCMCSCCPGILT